MLIKGELDIAAEREEVWSKLLDPVVLQRCIPGCRELEQVSEREFKARVQLKVGPVSATFAGTVTLGDLDPPRSCRLSGQGQGGMAGFAKGGADVALSELEDGRTRLSYDATIEVGGKIAALGGRLLQSTATKLSAQFFDRFAEEVRPAPLSVGSFPRCSEAV